MKKVKMTVPNKSYNGYYGGVAFHNGIRVFTDVETAKDLAERYGYKIEEVDTEVDTKVSTKVETEVEIEEEVKPKRKPRKAKAKVGE